MKTLNRTLSLVLVLVMVLGVFGIAGAAFTDQADVKHAEAVDVMAAIGVINGYTDGSFKPTGAITREEAAKVICYLTMGQAAADKLTASAAPFTDVDADRWSAGSIAYCVQQGIIAGRGNGTFDPTANVTGYEFSKMLLVVLGYDATIEQFTGPSWAINVAKRAFQNDISVGNDAFNGNAPATREESALYALNLIQAELVDYDSKGTNITLPDGTTVNTGASAAKSTGKTFMENYYKGLDVTVNVDAQGRTANVWTLKGVEIGRYAANADHTYTAAASGSTTAAKVASMGLTGFTLADGSVTPVINNVDGPAVTTLAELVDLTGNGRLVEVNVNPDKAREITSITVVDSYLAQITAINTTAKTATVKTVNGTTITTNNDTNPKVYTALSGMKVKDYILISKRDDNSAITSVALPTTATGTVTKLTGTAPDVTGVTVAGTAYSLSKNNVDVKDLTSAVMTAKSNVTLYLDSYGYAIYVTDAAVSDQYMAVVKVTQTVTNGVLTTTAIGYTPAGTPVALNLGGLLSNELPTVGALYSYAPATATAPTGADYEIDLLDAALDGDAGDLKNATYVALLKSDIGDTTLKASQAKTFSDVAGGVANLSADVTELAPYAPGVKFIFVDKDAGTVTVKNGVQTVVPGTAAMALITIEDGVTYVSAVYVASSAPDAAGSSILYLSKSTGSEYVNGVSYNSYKAWVDGAEVSILTKADNSGKIGSFCTYAKDEATGIYTLAAAAENTASTAAVDNGVALADPTTGTASYVINTGSEELNASDAVIINLTDKAIGSVSDINDLVADAEMTVTVALVYNNLPSNAGYKTVSYIFVEDVTATTYAITNTTETISASGDSGAYTVSVAPASATAGATVTVTIKLTTAVSNGTDTLTLTGTSVTPSGTVTFDNTNSVNDTKTITFTMPAAAVADLAVAVSNA